MYNANSIDLDKVRCFLREKEKRRKRSLTGRLQRAQADFDRIVEHVIHTYKPRRIYQWGSLLNTTHFSEISDIDIALEGLRGPEEYFAVIGDAMQMTSLPIDIIELEKIGTETAEYIRTKGRLVYDRRDG